MNYKDLKFPWYRNGIKSIKPEGLISLDQFMKAIISPKPSMVKAFADIAEAGRKGDLLLKDELKTKNLFFTTPSVLVEPIRDYKSIKEFLPFAVVEYDKIEYADVLRDYIFEKHKSCIFAFLSPSKTGCKFIFLIDKPTSVEDYKELYFGLIHDLEAFKNLDISNERCVLPLFNSFDPDAKFREDAVPSTKRGYKLRAFKELERPDFIRPEEVDKETEERVITRIKELFDSIDGEGHPKVLRYSFLIGGWASGNYITEELAQEIINDRIENNEYLSKGVEGYKTTAKQMFNKGLSFPAEFE